MKILFSCSESKNKDEKTKEYLSKECFEIFNNFGKTKLLLEQYQEIINKKDKSLLKKILGVSSEEKTKQYMDINIFKTPVKKAVQRYDGVGYKYLSYEKMNKTEQEFIDNNVIIFSNLFGVILAKDKIPFYKLKQNIKLNDIKIDKFYQEIYQEKIEDFISNDLIIDLRANSYSKFFNVDNVKHIKMKFYKNNKIISHYSKAYRGKVLNLLTKENIKTNISNIDDVLNISFEDMNIIDVKTNKNETMISYDVA